MLREAFNTSEGSWSTESSMCRWKALSRSGNCKWQGESERWWGLATTAGKRCWSVEPSTRRKCKWHILKCSCSATKKSGSAYGWFWSTAHSASESASEEEISSSKMIIHGYARQRAQFATFGRARLRSAALYSARLCSALLGSSREKGVFLWLNMSTVFKCCTHCFVGKRWSVFDNDSKRQRSWYVQRFAA